MANRKKRRIDNLSSHSKTLEPTLGGKAEGVRFRPSANEKKEGEPQIPKSVPMPYEALSKAELPAKNKGLFADVDHKAAVAKEMKKEVKAEKKVGSDKDQMESGGSAFGSTVLLIAGMAIGIFFAMAMFPQRAIISDLADEKEFAGDMVDIEGETAEIEKEEDDGEVLDTSFVSSVVEVPKKKQVVEGVGSLVKKAEKKVAEKKVAEKKVAEKKVAEKKVAEKKSVNKNKPTLLATQPKTTQKPKATPKKRAISFTRHMAIEDIYVKGQKDTILVKFLVRNLINKRNKGHVYGIAKVKKENGDIVYLASPSSVKVNSKGQAMYPSKGIDYNIDMMVHKKIAFKNPPGEILGIRVVAQSEGGAKTSMTMGLKN